MHLIKKLAGLTTVAMLLVSASASAAPQTLGGMVGKFAAPLTSVRVPMGGTVGASSLFTLSQFPGLKRVNVPVIGPLGGVPVFGGLTAVQGVATLQAIAPFQKPLPGLGSFRRTP